jgi:hypothetical protein
MPGAGGAAAEWGAGGVAAAVKGKEYLVAVDPAGGGSEGDYSAAQVLEMETGLAVRGVCRACGRIGAGAAGDGLAAEYNHAWLVVERNNHGSGVLALAETVCGYGRIYRQGGQAGWLTTSVSRPAVLGQAGRGAGGAAGVLSEPEAAGECRSFVRLPNGGTGARPGTHDDRVMAMAIGLGARAELLGRAGTRLLSSQFQLRVRAMTGSLCWDEIGKLARLE